LTLASQRDFLRQKMRWQGKLIPKYEPKRNRYRLEISATISKSGDRERKFFQTREAAWEAVRLERKRMELEGTGQYRSRLQSTAELIDSNNAWKVLYAYRERHFGNHKPLPRLEDLAKRWVREAEKESASVTLARCFGEYRELIKADVSAKTLQCHEYARRKFTPLLQTLVCNLTAQSIEGILQGLSTHAFNGYRRDLNTVLNYAVKRGYLTRNPVAAIFKRRFKKRRIVTLSNQTVRAMLEYARAHEPKFLIYPILTTLVGVRPEGELSRLQVKDLDLEHRELVIHEGKTGEMRPIPLEDSAVEWLRLCPIDGQPDDPLVPFTEAQLRRVRRRVWTAINYPPDDGSLMRATYATNLFSIGKPVEYLIRCMGHSDSEITFQKYAKVVSERDAREFWSIRPSQPALASAA
jgi:integrase